LALREKLETYFEFGRLGTNWRTEILAGMTTFMTMAYIIFVNPSILHETGMPYTAVVGATCFCAGFASILMGIFARYPIALAPGMGLNAYLAYVVVKGMGVSWPVALGAVFLSGVAFLILTLTGVRRLIVSALPTELFAAVAVGIGMFIALIGFRGAGIIVPSPSTTVTLGNLHDPTVLLAIAGLILMAALMAWGVRAAILIGMLATAGLGAILGHTEAGAGGYGWSGITATWFRLDIPGAARLGLIEIVFVFLFVDMFDNLGTLVGVGKKAGLFTETNEIPRLNRILLVDSTATIVSSLAGTSTVVSYIESAAGVVAGGRTGVVAIVAGLLFFGALFLAPVTGPIPAFATAPALILVGSMMASHAAEINWADPLIALPAFLTITTIPLTFSIANGLAFGFCSYTFLRVARGEFRKVGWFVYVLTALFMARFVYIGSH
jgi:adenine/guanine/hypoxanthine permease